MPQNGLFTDQQLAASPIVRGVVVATYYADDQGAREVALRQRDLRFSEIKAVACDVLTYGGRFRAFLTKVPVAQARHGLNDYTGLWIPRPSMLDLSTGTAPNFDGSKGAVSDPKNLDGDHVLVEFLEGDPMQPFIRSELPHPRANYRQVRAAGNAVESRFRGVVTRIDNDGNVVVDTTKANSGAVDANGAETPSADANHGNVTLKIAKTAKLTILGVDQNGANEQFALVLEDGKLTLRLDGAGGFHVPIAEKLQALYGDAATPGTIANFLATHTHPDGFGSTGPPADIPPAWDPAINSTKVEIPEG